MPPQISDDEGSQASEQDLGFLPQTSKSGHSPEATAMEEEESLMVESDDNGEDTRPKKKKGDVDEEDDEDEDDEVREGEYVVEAITNHIIDEDGVIYYEVKWEGFEKKSDRTMEPEENLAETASEILSEYLAKVGGKEALMKAWREKKEASKRGRKRAHSSTDANGSTNGHKRGKRSAQHPRSGSPPSSARNAEFKPPSGSWEEEVTAIDACEGAEGSIVVFLTWKGGQKSQHPLAQIYKRCPQKMLKFYESHLVFKKSDANSTTD